MENYALPNNQRDALIIASVFYFTGKPCKYGHLSPRYTTNTCCVECKKISDSTYVSKNKIKVFSKRQKWAKANPERVLKIKAKYRSTHREKIANKERNKRDSNTKYRLSSNLTKSLGKYLKRKKGFRHWEDIVQFKLIDLINHLEIRFRDGMTWENYGKYWHVDHIKPLSLCSSLEEAWALNNLQPLLAKENLSKRNRYIG